MTESILAPKTLTEVADLNSAFLDLLVSLLDNAASDDQAVLGLDQGLVLEIRSLPRKRRAEMAHCPYTLFSLRFNDSRYWESAVQGQVPVHYRDNGLKLNSEASDALARFCLTALLFARHLAATNTFDARLMLGLPGDSGSRLDAVPVVLMQHLATVNTGLLRARFADHPRFWPDMVWCATHGNATQRSAARLLGAHLIAGQVGADE